MELSMKKFPHLQKSLVAVAALAVLSGGSALADTTYGDIANTTIQGNSDGNATGEGVFISSNGTGGDHLTADNSLITVLDTGNINTYSAADTLINVDTDDGGYGGFYVNDYNGGSSTVTVISSNDLTTTITDGSGNTVSVGPSGTSITAGAGDSNTITGTTNINTTGTAGTSIGGLSGGDITLTNGNGTTASTLVLTDSGTAITGTLSSTGNTTLGTDANTVNTIGNAGTSTNTITGATNNMTATTANNITGTTNINVSANNATNINTGTSTGAVTIGNALAGDITLQSSASSTLVVGDTGTAITGTLSVSGNTSLNGATNTIGTTQLSTNTIGNATVGTTVTATGGNSTLSIANGAASLTTTGTASIGATGGGSYSAYSTDQVVGTDYTLQAGNAASQALVTGATVTNIIQGDTLVDGNMYINGTLTYSSNSAATTTVTSGTSVLVGATQDTTGQMSIVNAGGTGAVVDANGQITTGVTTQSTASLTLTNGVGNTHGLVVTESQATMSGGVNSTSLTLNDSGARFSNSATGAPVTVTGVADGRSDFDAVNVRQYSQAIAAVTATANIPVPDAGKNVSVGVGLGNFMGKTALAFGGHYRMSANSMIKASIASGVGSGSKPVFGVGAGWSW
jgi:hypothetical protein